MLSVSLVNAKRELSTWREIGWQQKLAQEIVFPTRETLRMDETEMQEECRPHDRVQISSTRIDLATVTVMTDDGPAHHHQDVLLQEAEIGHTLEARAGATVGAGAEVEVGAYLAVTLAAEARREVCQGQDPHLVAEPAEADVLLHPTLVEAEADPTLYQAEAEAAVGTDVMQDLHPHVAAHLHPEEAGHQPSPETTAHRPEEEKQALVEARTWMFRVTSGIWCPKRTAIFSKQTSKLGNGVNTAGIPLYPSVRSMFATTRALLLQGFLLQCICSNA